MAPPGDNGRPWAELEAIYELVDRETDIDAAIRRVVGGYSSQAFKRLYDVTINCGFTFAKRVHDEEQTKRMKLVNYILGPANRGR